MYEGKSVIVLGWGRESNFDVHPDKLHRNFLTVYDYRWQHISILQLSNVLQVRTLYYKAPNARH